MSNSNNKYCTLETLLNELYCLFEVNSPVFTDELGYKWYELRNVLDILRINEDEYINGYYLMNIEDDEFISEEGINMLLIEYDNEYRDEVLNYITGDIMPDIKSDSMYLGLQILNDMRTVSIEHSSYCDDSNVIMTSVKVQKYTETKMNRMNKKHKIRDSKKGIRK
jgi:hypothetical protein